MVPFADPRDGSLLPRFRLNLFHEWCIGSLGENRTPNGEFDRRVSNHLVAYMTLTFAFRLEGLALTRPSAWRSAWGSRARPNVVPRMGPTDNSIVVDVMAAQDRVEMESNSIQVTRPRRRVRDASHAQVLNHPPPSNRPYIFIRHSHRVSTC